jgi:hypothetical protein
VRNLYKEYLVRKITGLGLNPKYLEITPNVPDPFDQGFEYSKNDQFEFLHTILHSMDKTTISYDEFVVMYRENRLNELGL